MIYLQDNPLLRQPLAPEHIKQRPLGHWGASPGLAFAYAHLTRLIRHHDLDAIFLAGPGHGAPGILGPAWLEGSLGDRQPQRGWGLAGLTRFCRDFSFPGGLGSHCTPEVPGSIHEGGELGYSLSHAFGAAFDNPELLVTVMVGDGEAETGPLATAWHSNKFLNPARDGAVLPILHLNGYKIANPTILARIPREELLALFTGYGWAPKIVEGHEPAAMHRAMAAAMDECLQEIRAIQQAARSGKGPLQRPRWPMIVLVSPKGWTGPRQADGHQVEGTWRAHQVPLADPRNNEENRRLLQEWLLSYRPQELFTEDGEPAPLLQDFAPRGRRRLGANPHANGGLLRLPLDRPDWRQQAITFAAPGSRRHSNTDPPGPPPGADHAKEPQQFPPLRPGRNRLQQAGRRLRSHRQDLAGGIPPRGRGRRPSRCRRPGHGNAIGTHPGRLARRLSADRPLRPPLHLRGLRPRHRLHVQPARQVAGNVPGRALAGAGGGPQPAHHLHRVAPGPQRFHPPGPGLPRPGGEQEPGK